jgi:Na+/phosphate symporter
MTRLSKAKTVAAAVGATLTALSVAATALQAALNDGAVSTGEVATLITTGVTLAGTVYAVWKTENKVLRSGN